MPVEVECGSHLFRIVTFAVAFPSYKLGSMELTNLSSHALLIRLSSEQSTHALVIYLHLYICLYHSIHMSLPFFILQEPSMVRQLQDTVELDYLNLYTKAAHPGE